MDNKKIEGYKESPNALQRSAGRLEKYSGDMMNKITSGVLSYAQTQIGLVVR